MYVLLELLLQLLLELLLVLLLVLLLLLLLSCRYRGVQSAPPLILIDLRVRGLRGPRGLGALGSPGKRSWVARLAVRLASSPVLINFSHSFRVFSFEPSRPGAILSRSDGPGVNFGG